MESLRPEVNAFAPLNRRSKTHAASHPSLHLVGQVQKKAVLKPFFP
jgi:hypothetical protein